MKRILSGRRGTALLCAVMAVAVAIAMTACGGSGGTATDTSAKDEQQGADTAQTAQADAADTLILGAGSVYLTSAADSATDALAIKDGKIVWTGAAAEAEAYKGDATEVIELADGQIAIPSFVEAHGHGNEGGTALLYDVDLYTGAESLEDYQAILKGWVEDHPALTFIRGNGWINGYAPEGGYTAAMLDEALPEGRKDLPVAVVSSDHHSWWVNTAALELIYEKTDLDKDGEKTPDPAGGVIERGADGKPTGVFREDAQSYVTAIVPEYTVDELKAGSLAYQEEEIGYGVTAAWDPMLNAQQIEAYRQLEDEGKLLLRTYAGYQVNAGDPLTVLDDVQKLIDENKGGMFEIKGIKIFADGVVEGHTAYLLDDYYDAPGKGESTWTQEQLDEMVTKADSMGITVHIHAIGDAATKLAVNAFEAAAEANGTGGKNRHAITHLQVVDPDDIARMGELGVVAVPNPYWFCQEPGYFTELEYPYLGPVTGDGKYPGGRAFSEYPMKAFFDAGVTVALASDYPVTNPAKPLDAVEAGVLRIDRYGDPASELNPVKDPGKVKPVTKDGVITGFENYEIDPALKQNVTLEQMLETSSFGGAYSLFIDDVIGTLEVGKEADVVILDRNIYTADPAEIGGNELPYVLPPEEAEGLGPADYGTNVLRTMLAGKTIYEMPQE